MWASHGVFPSQPGHNADLQRSHCTHEQESSQHMATVATSLPSVLLPASQWQAYTWAPPLFSLTPPFRPLDSPALSISPSYPSLLPSLPSLALPPFPSRPSFAASLQPTFPRSWQKKKKITGRFWSNVLAAGANTPPPFWERDGDERERGVNAGVCDRVCVCDRNGEGLALAKFHLLFPEKRQEGGREKQEELCNYSGESGKTCSLWCQRADKQFDYTVWDHNTCVWTHMILLWIDQFSL